jgi:hypothetical protein
MLNKISTLVSPARFAPTLTVVGTPSVLESIDRAVTIASTAVAHAEARAAAELKTFHELDDAGREAEVARNADSAFTGLHSFYGSMFLSKFATGQLENGMDVGVVSAKKNWGWALRNFTNKTVKRALADIAENPASKFRSQIPHLPEFCALCREFAPVAPKSDTLALTTRPDPKARTERAEKNRAMVARMRYKPEAEAVAAPGLDALKQAIASAVATAGGDEAAELRRLDAMLAPRAAGRGAAA